MVDMLTLEMKTKSQDVGKTSAVFNIMQLLRTSNVIRYGNNFDRLHRYPLSCLRQRTGQGNLLVIDWDL